MTVGCWAARVVILLAAVRLGWEVGMRVSLGDLSWTARVAVVLAVIWVPLAAYFVARSRPFRVADGPPVPRPE